MFLNVIRALILTMGLSAAANMQANTAIIPVPKDEKWLKRHEGFVDEAKRGGVDVLFLGDSITDGWRKEGRFLWAEHFAPLQAANFGLDGDRTQHVLWRIQHGTLDGLAPKVVVLLIGTNNTGPERNTTAEAVEGVQAVVTAIHQKLPAAKLLVLAILPRAAKDSPHRAQINEINRALRPFVEGMPSARFLDIGEVFLSADGSLSTHLMPDLLHPNEAGYALWAAAIKQPLADLLGGKSH